MNKILHLDVARKYFTVSQLKAFADMAAACGYDSIELYFSDNQGFRLALDDMNIISGGKTYDLSQALGDGYVDDQMDMCPDGSGKYLTAQEAAEVIAYAQSKGLNVIPSLNTPGHMGAILQHFPEFAYRDADAISANSLDVTNPLATEFALKMLDKYIAFFKACGCNCFNIVADEFACDIGGFEKLHESGNYPAFMDYLHKAITLVKRYNMTPWVFNDSLYYDDSEISSVPKDVVVCYWLKVKASAEEIASHGHQLVNAGTDLFWVLGKSDWQVSPEKIRDKDMSAFVCGSVTAPEAAMLCLWCDKADADSADGMLNAAKAAIETFGRK